MLNHKDLYDIYKIVVDASNYRGANEKPVNKEEFDSFVKKNKYYHVKFKVPEQEPNCDTSQLDDCSRAWNDIATTGHDVIYFLFKDDTNTKKDKFKKLIERNKAQEYMVIMPEVKSTMINTATELSNKSKIIRLIPRKLFHVNIARHIYSPRFEVAPKHEVATFLEHNKMEPIKLPKVLSLDIVSLWLGAYPGMVIKYTNASHISGEEIRYRLCVLSPTDRTIFTSQDEDDEIEEV